MPRTYTRRVRPPTEIVHAYVYTPGCDEGAGRRDSLGRPVSYHTAPWRMACGATVGDEVRATQSFRVFGPTRLGEVWPRARRYVTCRECVRRVEAELAGAGGVDAQEMEARIEAHCKRVREGAA